MPGEVGKGLAELVSVRVDNPAGQPQQRPEPQQQGRQQEGQDGQQQQTATQQQKQQGHQQEHLPGGQQAGPGQPNQERQPEQPDRHRGTTGGPAPPAGPRAAAARPRLDRGNSLLQRLTTLPPWLQTGQQQERREPMFCMELAIRLFYWSKYAYRHWVSWQALRRLAGRSRGALQGALLVDFCGASLFEGS